MATIPIPPTSVLALSIKSDIKSFLVNNSTLSLNDNEITPEIGCEMLANAIAYGISKAFASPSLQTALAAGVGPATAGPLIASTLAPFIIEA